MAIIAWIFAIAAPLPLHASMRTEENRVVCIGTEIGTIDSATASGNYEMKTGAALVIVAEFLMYVSRSSVSSSLVAQGVVAWSC